EGPGHRVRGGGGGARPGRDRGGGGAGGARGRTGPHGGAVEPRNDRPAAAAGPAGVGTGHGTREWSGTGDGRRGAAGRIDPGDGGRRGESAAGGREAARTGAGIPGLGTPPHRRDFFLPAGFFFGAGLGRAGLRGGLRLSAPWTSERTRSPSSGPIRPRRTA